MWFDLQFIELTPRGKILLEITCVHLEIQEISVCDLRFQILYLSDSYFLQFIALCRPLLRQYCLIHSVWFGKDAVGLMFWCLDFFCRKMLALSAMGCWTLFTK